MQPKFLVLAIKLHEFDNWNNKIKAPTNFNQSKCLPIFNFKRALEKIQAKIKVVEIKSSIISIFLVEHDVNRQLLKG